MDLEQTTATTEETTSDEATDADLIAAAQEVGGAASVNVEAEAATAGAEPVKVETTEPEEPKIAAILRAREKAFAERNAADDYAAQRRAQADQEATKVLADARKRAADDYEAEMQARRNKFKESPTQALREFGVPTDDLVDQVAREGTAEWKAMRRIEAELAATRAEAAEGKKAAAEFEQWKNQQAEQQHQQRVTETKALFLNQHASPELTPYLHKRYEPEEIYQAADALARKWQAAQVPFAYSDLAQYLEHESRKRILGDAASALPQQVSGTSGNATKVKANGSRTLSAANGSERRASPKPIDEMSPEEERNALIEAVRDARRQSGG